MLHTKAFARALFEKGIEALAPKNLHLNLSGIEDKEVTILGVGKGALPIVQSLSQILAPNVKKALVVSNYAKDIPDIEVLLSDHPIPGARSVVAAERLLGEVAQLTPEDYLLFVLTGGASALVEKPISSVTLEEMADVTRKLLSSGATIDEINTVRKQLSAVKGGRLGAKVACAGKVFVVSDVIGDDLQTIGSGLMYCDSSTAHEGCTILMRYGLWDTMPPSVQSVLQHAPNPAPKLPNPKLSHQIVASNRIALEAIAKAAEAAGYQTQIVTDRLSGDVREAAERIVQTVCTQQSHRPLCLLFGGETTVQVRGEGQGGRNQELALWVLKSMRQKGVNFTFLSAGSDGIDGMSDAAGAVVDSTDFREDIDDFLTRNDSYRYHRRGGSLIVTGATGTNVMDIMIVVKES